MKHISDKDIISLYLAGDETNYPAWMKKHLGECTVCSKKLEDIKLVYSGTVPETFIAPYGLEDRVRATYRAKTIAGSDNRSFSAKHFFSPQVLAAAVVLIIIGASLLLYRNTFLDGNFFTDVTTLPVEYTIDRGTALINKGDADNTGTVSEGETFSTLADSSIRIYSGESFKLRAGPETVLTLSTARSIDGAATYHFNARQGWLLSQINHGIDKINYSIETPHGRIESMGTVFYTAISGTSTEVTLAEGKLRITCKATGEVINGLPGNRYAIKKIISQRVADKEILSRISDFTLTSDVIIDAAQKKPDREIQGENVNDDSTRKNPDRTDGRKKFDNDHRGIHDQTREIRAEMKRDERKQMRDSKRKHGTGRDRDR